MEKTDGNCRENTALAKRSGHDADNQHIKNRFYDQRRAVTVDAVLNGADNRHSTDTDRKGSRYESINEGLLAAVSGFHLKPYAEAFKKPFKVDDFADN